MKKKICIVGSGTAGLLAAVMIKTIFSIYEVTVIASNKIGIIGVGEGSTEHWRNQFMRPFGINSDELVKYTKATHKYGIRYENWTNHTPDYFHSIALEPMTAGNFWGNYAQALENNWQLTKISSPNLMQDKVIKHEQPHETTNQYHFDTYALNEYLSHVAHERGVVFYDAIVKSIEQDPETGWIKSIISEDGLRVEADFVIDASGFNRVIMSELSDKDDFVNYRKYLPCDSTAVFQTPLDESGKIHPYTRARAMKNGWMFEIPTQERRGNGYIFSSDFCSDEDAVKELCEVHNIDIEPRIIKWKSGYFKNPIQFNCAAIGLAASFVEPLEATSISTTIQQVREIVTLLPTFDVSSKAVVKQYSQRFENLMDNILCMISLHYISDRDDTEMWRAQRQAEIPETLQNMLALWKERSPQARDIIGDDGSLLFHTAHFYHVAQGQNLLSSDKASIELDAYDSRPSVNERFTDLFKSNLRQETVDHASLFAKK